MHPKIRLGEIDPSENLGVLLIEFFEFYGQYFNYNDCGICIVNGGSYYRKARRGWADLKQPYLMSVEDPTDPSSPDLFTTVSRTDIELANDIARGSFQVRSIRKAFAGASFILVTRLLQLREQREALYSGRYTRLRPESDPERVDSTLGALIGVSEKVMHYYPLLIYIYTNMPPRCWKCESASGISTGVGRCIATCVSNNRTLKCSVTTWKRTCSFQCPVRKPYP
jgi:non-canonical poly(A) RNA polymerase PAPD5/7